jgi:hypothetical protein
MWRADFTAEARRARRIAAKADPPSLESFGTARKQKSVIRNVMRDP